MRHNGDMIFFSQQQGSLVITRNDYYYHITSRHAFKLVNSVLFHIFLQCLLNSVDNQNVLNQLQYKIYLHTLEVAVDNNFVTSSLIRCEGESVIENDSPTFLGSICLVATPQLTFKNWKEHSRVKKVQQIIVPVTDTSHFSPDLGADLGEVGISTCKLPVRKTATY